MRALSVKKHGVCACACALSVKKTWCVCVCVRSLSVNTWCVCVCSLSCLCKYCWLRRNAAILGAATTADQQGGISRSAGRQCVLLPRRISRAAFRDQQGGISRSAGRQCVLLPRRISRAAFRDQQGRHFAISRAAVRAATTVGQVYTVCKSNLACFATSMCATNSHTIQTRHPEQRKLHELFSLKRDSEITSTGILDDNRVDWLLR